MEFISFLNDHVSVPIWIIGIVAFLAGVIALYKNFATIREMGRKFKSCVKRVTDFRRRRKRRKYNEIVASESYLNWQGKLLNDIYEPIIREYNARKAPNAPACEWAVCFPDSKNAYKYESVYFKVDENLYPYPFSGMSDKGELSGCELSERILPTDEADDQFPRQYWICPRYHFV